MSEYKYEAICHTTCYWLETLWDVGEVYEGNVKPNKHFSRDGIKPDGLPAPTPGDDARSNDELVKALSAFGVRATKKMGRKKLWSKLVELENAALKDELINPSTGSTQIDAEEPEMEYEAVCGYTSKTNAGALAHQRKCGKCREIIELENVGNTET